MKSIRMSLAAAMLMGASAYAIDNVKVNGDAKFFYNTSNSDYTKDGSKRSGLFDQGVVGEGGSQADAGLRIGATGDLLKNISFGVTGHAISTLGLENNVVSNAWSGAHSNGSAAAGTSGVKDAAWLSELWIAGTAGNTTGKAGRMQLDTPWVFSETWSIAPNTFEGAVLINKDLPDTTVVAGWIGKGNGANALGYNNRGIGGVDNNSSGIGWEGGVIGKNADFNTFLHEGAYAIGAINNTLKPLTTQAWYYDALAVADAYWLQADIDFSLLPGVKLGAQYANLDPKGKTSHAGITENSSAYAFKIGYEGIENLKLSAAFSQVDDKGSLKVSNIATNNTGIAQSKLYTEAFMNYGYVGAPDARAYSVSAEYTADIAKFGMYITNVRVNDTKAQVVTLPDGTDMREVTLTAYKSFGPLDVILAYFSTDADDQNKKNSTDTNGQRYDSLQAYLILNF